MKEYEIIKVLIGNEFFNDFYLNKRNYDKIIISVSGGYDSTLLLARILKLLKENNKTDTYVLGIYCNHPYIDNDKRDKEIVSLKLIEKELKKEYDNFDINFININIEGNVQKINNNHSNRLCNLGWSQPQIWLSSVLPFITLNSCVLFGYIEGDQLLSYFNLDNFSKMLDVNMVLLNGNNCNKNNDKIILGFPLGEDTKGNILYQLESDFPNLIDLCWTCEYPIEDTLSPNRVTPYLVPCNQCTSCRSLKLGKLERKELFPKIDNKKEN